MSIYRVKKTKGAVMAVNSHKVVSLMTGSSAFAAAADGPAPSDAVSASVGFSGDHPNKFVKRTIINELNAWYTVPENERHETPFYERVGDVVVSVTKQLRSLEDRDEGALLFYASQPNFMHFALNYVRPFNHIQLDFLKQIQRLVGCYRELEGLRLVLEPIMSLYQMSCVPKIYDLKDKSVVSWGIIPERDVEAVVKMVSTTLAERLIPVCVLHQEVEQQLDSPMRRRSIDFNLTQVREELFRTQFILKACYSYEKGHMTLDNFQKILKASRPIETYNVLTTLLFMLAYEICPSLPTECIVSLIQDVFPRCSLFSSDQSKQIQESVRFFRNADFPFFWQKKQKANREMILNALEEWKKT